MKDHEICLNGAKNLPKVFKLVKMVTTKNKMLHGLHNFQFSVAPFVLKGETLSTWKMLQQKNV